MTPDRFFAELRRERFLIVGIGGRTGVHAARLFARMRVPFAVSDSAPLATIAPLLEGLPLGPGDVYTGPQEPSQLRGITRILLSPGVPRAIPLLAAARERGLPITCDHDLLYPLLADKPTVAITGTDGKTTTTSLVAHILSPDMRVVVAGNIGTPITGFYDDLFAADVIVLELSSFMLEDMTRFRAKVGAVLNVAEDHVDRYPSLDAYEATKRALVRHARPGDVFIRNLDDERVARWRLPGLDVRTVSLVRRDADARVEEGALCLGDARVPADRLLIRGLHHRSNALVAASIAHALGVPARAALERATTFPGVPHRFELAFEEGGVEVIDDSKATSIQAVLRALEGLAGREVVLILGGRDKMLDPSLLGREASHLRAVVGYGEAGRRLLRAFEGAGGPEVAYEERFADAVERAARLCRRGDVLLLSPACTSWDQHADYVERGLVFREVARRALSGGRSSA
jgi:UDP-N-acetylmuramoylalanine--D-glutamate ligase